MARRKLREYRAVKDQCEDLSSSGRRHNHHGQWEEMWQELSRSSSPNSSPEFEQARRHSLLPEALSVNQGPVNGLSIRGPNAVIRYTEHNKLTCDKPTVPKYELEKRQEGNVSDNYLPDGKYDHPVHNDSTSLSLKILMKRGMYLEAREYNTTPTVAFSAVPSKPRTKAFLDEPPYVRKAHGERDLVKNDSASVGSERPQTVKTSNCITARDGNPLHDSSLGNGHSVENLSIHCEELTCKDESSAGEYTYGNGTQTNLTRSYKRNFKFTPKIPRPVLRRHSEILNSELPAYKTNGTVQSTGDKSSDCWDGEDPDENDLWVSGNSLLNVTAWMIRNEEHLHSVLDNVSSTDINGDSRYPDSGPSEEGALCDEIGQLALCHATEAPMCLKDHQFAFTTDLGTQETASELGGAVKQQQLTPRTSFSSRSTAGISAEFDAVRDNFRRMRMAFRDRHDSTRSAPPRHISPSGSSNRPSSLSLGSDHGSVKCYMEIVGSDISAPSHSNSTTPRDNMNSYEGSLFGCDSSSQLQSLSELAIIENMADLLKDIEKSDLVLAEHMGWLRHDQSGCDRWCVIADIIMCVFESQHSNKPVLSILLPGADIYNPQELKSRFNHISNKNQKCRTPEFGITIDSNIAGQKHTFYAKNLADFTKWMNSLKMAAEFEDDADNEGEFQTSGNRSPPLNGFDTEEGYSFNHLSTNETGIELEMSLGSPDSLDSPVLFTQKKTFHLDLGNSCSDLSLQSESSTTSKESGISMLDSTDFKKMLRREVKDKGRQSPLKTSASTHDMFLSPPLDRHNFRSMDQLDRLVLGRSNSNPLSSNSHAQEVYSSQETFETKSTSVSRSKSQSLRRPISQSMDLSKMNPLTSGLVRKASGLKERVFGRRKSLQNLTLGSLEDIKMSGFLQHKVLLKWQKLYCVISRGYLYAFKAKIDSERPEFMAILSNYSVTYLLSDRQKKHKNNKQFVFKLSQPGRKSIYLCAANNLDLARWIQVVQMEASKVSVDRTDSAIDGFESDSWVTPGLFAKTNAMYALGFPANELEDVDTSFFNHSSMEEANKLSSTCVSEGLEVVSTEQGRVTVSHHLSHQFNDNEIITAWDTSSSCSTIYSSTLESSSNNSLDNVPRHDDAVAKVWETDGRYRFSAMRKHAQRLKNTFSDRKKESPTKVTCKIVIDNASEFEECPSPDTNEVQSTNREVENKTGPEQKSTTSPSTGALSPPVPRRHKPVSVRQLPVSLLGQPDHCGYLERRHQDGTWVRYWYCVKSGWLYCYLTPADLLTVDMMRVDQFSVTTLPDRFPTKTHVIQLSHARYVDMYLAAESEAEMTAWSQALGRGVSCGPTQSPTSPPPPPCQEADLLTGVLSDDSSVPDDSGSAAEIETSTAKAAICTDATSAGVATSRNSIATSNATISEARQNLLDQVMRLKQDLEQKQMDTRRKRETVHVSQSVPSLYEKEEEDQLVQEITSLRQRRLSTQLKVDTLQRQMDLKSLTATKKRPLFRLGGRKSPPPVERELPGNPLMEEQVRELTGRLEVIDKDLSHRENDRRARSSRWLDVENNNNAKGGRSPELPRRSGLFSGKSDKESRKRSHSLKVTVSNSLESPRLLEAGGSAAVNQRHESFHGRITPPTDSSQNNISLARVNKTKGWFWRKKADKETGQSEVSQTAPSETRLDLHSLETPTVTPTDTPKVSPRREISPQVLADIEEFEQMTKVALQKAQSCENGTLPNKR